MVALTGHIESTNKGSDSSFVAGAVMLSCMLGAGSDSKDEVCADLTGRHFWWACLLLGNTADEPLTVNSMLNCRAYVMLIEEDLVRKLGLHCFRLHNPVTISLAIDNGTPSPATLDEYIKISPFAPDGQWSSNSVKAVIAPKLCVPLLLGIPFLNVNKIVMDFNSRTAIDKRCNYDLLNPPIFRYRKHVFTAKAERAMKKESKDKLKASFTELVEVCQERLKAGKYIPEEIKPLDIAGMIRDQIECLSVEEKLKAMEKVLMDEFRDVFEPIPHVDKLPENITARIKLKNVEQMIKSWMYSCPCNFREAWQTLIQQHLKAGHICPSSSPHTSPAFIIPKADAMVLPRWVNDYRQLNKNTVTNSHPLPCIYDILNDCAKGQIWGTIDMTNSFFQTQMHPEDIVLTTVTTPFGLFEWMVMPMGLKNAPAIHQRHVTTALRPWIGKNFHIYLDGIVV